MTERNTFVHKTNFISGVLVKKEKDSLERPVKASIDSVHPERADSFKRLDLATTCEPSGGTELKKRTAAGISKHLRKLKVKSQLQLSISKTQTLIAQCIRHNI